MSNLSMASSYYHPNFLEQLDRAASQGIAQVEFGLFRSLRYTLEDLGLHLPFILAEADALEVTAAAEEDLILAGDETRDDLLPAICRMLRDQNFFNLSHVTYVGKSGRRCSFCTVFPRVLVFLEDPCARYLLRCIPLDLGSDPPGRRFPTA